MFSLPWMVTMLLIISSLFPVNRSEMMVFDRADWSRCFTISIW